MEQHIKKSITNQNEYNRRRILLKYKQLKEHAPSGIYIVPSLNPMRPATYISTNESRSDNDCIHDCTNDCVSDCRLSTGYVEEDHGMYVFYGVIYVRRGMYRNAMIFKFKISLPWNYNTHQSFPKVHFFRKL